MSVMNMNKKFILLALSGRIKEVDFNLNMVLNNLYINLNIFSL